MARLAPSIVAALLGSLAVAGISYWRQRGNSVPAPTTGRAFNLWHAVGFATLLTGVTAVVSLTSTYLGDTAAAAATAVAGAFDVHAATTSTLMLAAGGKLTMAATRTPILIALSANTASKLVAAFVAGGRVYGMEVGVGLTLAVAMAWIPLLFF
jgi:uncharacterized membrane protein (DUF4010 family)